jgi:hypothetical protein
MESARDIWSRAEINEMHKKLLELEKQLAELGKQQERKRKRAKAATQSAAAAAAAEDDDGGVRVMCCPHCSKAVIVTLSK